MSPPPPPPSSGPPSPGSLKARPITLEIPSIRRRSSSTGRLDLPVADDLERRRSSQISLIEELNALFGRKASTTPPESPVSLEKDKFTEKNDVLKQLTDGDEKEEESGKGLKDSIVVIIPPPSIANPPPPPPPEALKEKKVVLIISKKELKKKHKDTPRPSLERPKLDPAFLQELQARMNDYKPDSAMSIEQKIEESRSRRESEIKTTSSSSWLFGRRKRIIHEKSSELETGQQQKEAASRKLSSRSVQPKELFEAIAKRFGRLKVEKEKEAKGMDTKAAETEQETNFSSPSKVNYARSTKSESDKRLKKTKEATFTNDKDDGKHLLPTSCSLIPTSASAHEAHEQNTLTENVATAERTLESSEAINIVEADKKNSTWYISSDDDTPEVNEGHSVKEIPASPQQLFSNNKVTYDDLGKGDPPNKAELKDIPGVMVLKSPKQATQYATNKNKNASNLNSDSITNIFSMNELSGSLHNLCIGIGKGSSENAELSSQPSIAITEKNSIMGIDSKPPMETDLLKNNRSKQESDLKSLKASKNAKAAHQSGTHDRHLRNAEKDKAIDVAFSIKLPLSSMDINRQNFSENQDTLPDEQQIHESGNPPVASATLHFAELEALVIESQEIMSHSQKDFNSSDKRLQKVEERLRQLEKEECRVIERNNEKKVKITKLSTKERKAKLKEEKLKLIIDQKTVDTLLFPSPLEQTQDISSSAQSSSHDLELHTEQSGSGETVSTRLFQKAATEQSCALFSSEAFQDKCKKKTEKSIPLVCSEMNPCDEKAQLDETFIKLVEAIGTLAESLADVEINIESCEEISMKKCPKKGDRKLERLEETPNADKNISESAPVDKSLIVKEGSHEHLAVTSGLIKQAVGDDKPPDLRSRRGQAKATDQIGTAGQVEQSGDTVNGDDAEKPKAVGINSRWDVQEQSDSVERWGEKPPRRPSSDPTHIKNCADEGERTNTHAAPRPYRYSQAVCTGSIESGDQQVEKERKNSGPYLRESSGWRENERRQLDTIFEPTKCFPYSAQRRTIDRVEMNSWNGLERNLERNQLWSFSAPNHKHFAPRDVKQRDRERKAQSRSNSAAALEETMRKRENQIYDHRSGSHDSGISIPNICINNQPISAAHSLGHFDDRQKAEADEIARRIARMDGEASSRQRRSSAHGALFHSQVRAKRSESEHRNSNLLQSKYRDLPRLTSQMKYDSPQQYFRDSRSSSIQHPYDNRPLYPNGSSTSIDSHEYSSAVTPPPRQASTLSPRSSIDRSSSPYWYPTAMHYEVPKYVQKETHSREASVDRSGLSILQYRATLEKKL